MLNLPVLPKGLRAHGCALRVTICTAVLQLRRSASSAQETPAATAEAAPGSQRAWCSRAWRGQRCFGRRQRAQAPRTQGLQFAVSCPAELREPPAPGPCPTACLHLPAESAHPPGPGLGAVPACRPLCSRLPAGDRLVPPLPLLSWAGLPPVRAGLLLRVALHADERHLNTHQQQNSL